MNLPLVSILIPSYNSEQYIKETIESCINQSYKNIEIIIVDDGSTDNSLNILKDFENKHYNIKVLKQKNAGAPAARNLAFQNSNGNYIQYLDSDDILDQNKIYSQLKLLEKENLESVIFGPVKYFQNSLNNSWEYHTLNTSYESSSKLLIDLWLSSKSILVHTWLTPRNIIEKVGEWDINILKNQDGVYFAKVLKISNKVIYDKNSLSYCRIDNSSSISRKKSFKSEKSRLESFLEYEKLFQNDLTNDVKKAIAIQYSDFIFNNYPENKELCSIANDKIKLLGFNKPIYQNNRLYKSLAPFIGIYNSIYLHKKISFLKQIILSKLRG